jgi:nucleoside-diphosphate-sugar epimerase
VVALSRTPRPSTDEVRWVQGDLTDAQAIAELISDVDCVLHCAGAVRGARAADFDTTNVLGTQRVADAASRAGVERLLSLSSLAAREPSLSFYASSKRMGEAVLEHADVPWTVFRPPAVYGPGDRELAPLFDLMLKGFAVTPRHGGHFSLLYVSDLVAAMVAWLDAPQVAGRCYELDDGMAGGYDWDRVVSIARQVRGRAIVRWRVPRGVLAVPAAVNQMAGRALHLAPMLTPGKVRELYFPDWVSRTEEACAALDWRARVDFAAGLRLTFPG